MILGQDLAKLTCIFYLFPLYSVSLKNKTTQVVQSNIVLVFVQCLGHCDCCWKQYKCSMSALSSIWTAASDRQKELVSEIETLLSTKSNLILSRFLKVSLTHSERGTQSCFPTLYNSPFLSVTNTLCSLVPVYLRSIWEHSTCRNKYLVRGPCT